ncbi:NUDIX hydrolase [Parvularcula dongshanensis]|uniref:NrtR DNA-binding winged helix domain-containing protein n=1 Tax=Parvularcula dongshanensis TaxID=1173995 RepID=A0A840I3X0_9PROT|nr:NAD regulator [Parvularcula dongshanensis]MBB4658971.1 hypothetical protein [Parvularcula dongshanensis]
MQHRVVIGLNAVVTALMGGEPHVLCVRREDGWGLPYGAFDPVRHRTFEIGMRDFVSRQTALTLGYAEQLYTFGDEGREAPLASLSGGEASDRIVSVGYLALSPEAGSTGRREVAWRSWYDHFPWEDRRRGDEALGPILDALMAWAAGEASRQARIALAFGQAEEGWQEERALDRYELMYEAGLVPEAERDGHAGGRRMADDGAMTSDHRRILATAIGRLRGKLRYRPVIFELVPDPFTLSDLQEAVEGVLGFCVHKQNFRRAVEATGLVRKTGETAQGTGGRPAALYARARVPVTAGLGLTLPRLRAECA